jgi:SAM-dependent methyltransferase
MTKYYHDSEVHNLEAPKEIVPILCKMFEPKSVVDVGCGLGTFLKVFSDFGISEITGFEGEWLIEKKLYVPKEKVKIVDLETNNWAKGWFDLAVSLEVAEHLNSTVETEFVRNLTSLSEVIVFSAALEGQGGQNHINEKPLESWIRIFNQCGYHFFDVFRMQFWNSKNINWWYKQNMFLVLKKDSKWFELFNNYPMDFEIMSFVHPDCLKQNFELNQHLKKEYEKLSKIKTFDIKYIFKQKLRSLFISRNI